MQKTDLNTSVADLKKTITDFRNARGWDKYNDPYDIAVALSVEASEILQLLLWSKNTDVLALIAAEPELKERLAAEIADVFALTLTLSDSLDFDLTQAFLSKMVVNGIKYPLSQDTVKCRKRWLE